MNNDLYQHEAVQQLAVEFGRANLTAEDISKDEITHMLKAMDTERFNPTHDSPAEWVKSWFTFLRQTGKFAEMLESPRRFARVIIREFYSGGSHQPESNSESANEQA